MSHPSIKKIRLYFDEKNIVRLASTKPIVTTLYQCVEIDEPIANPLGKRLVFNRGAVTGQMRVAVVANWDAACGISTYTKYLVDALAPKVDTVRIFSEKTSSEKVDSQYDVTYCWSRGESLRRAAKEIMDWGPSVVLIQHEYGIFPKTPYFLQMLQRMEDIPYVVTMHSVYEHLDKTIQSSVMRNIIVHTTSGQDCLRRLGNKNRIWVIPHGCVTFDDMTELWNTWQTPYPIVQFGFGFDYKGVDVALEAISLLKRQQPSKYRNIFYTYFCSENSHIRNIIDEYCRKMMRRIEELDIQDNAAIVRGYQSDQTLNNCLRTSRLVIFPYKTDPRNVTYGASGAIRIAMANGLPIIASSSHMFDDMDGVLPRPRNAEELAREIDYVFSNDKYRQGILDRSANYIQDNSWPTTANRYLQVFQEVKENSFGGVIFV